MLGIDKWLNFCVTQLTISLVEQIPGAILVCWHHAYLVYIQNAQKPGHQTPGNGAWFRFHELQLWRGKSKRRLQKGKRVLKRGRKMTVGGVRRSDNQENLKLGEKGKNKRKEKTPSEIRSQKWEQKTERRNLDSKDGCILGGLEQKDPISDAPPIILSSTDCWNIEDQVSQ